MKNLSKQQLSFAIVCVALTASFLYTLNKFISNQQWESINIIAIIYGALMFVNGLLNGYFDTNRLLRIDLSFRYHLITFITVNGVHVIFLLLANTNFTIVNALLSTLFWGIGLFVHYLYAKKTIKGYTAEELFE